MLVVCLSSLLFSSEQENPPASVDKASSGARTLVHASLLLSSEQEKRPANADKISTGARTLVQLSICDFSLADKTEQSAYYSALQKAIPDTLYLRFLSNPRLQVSRNTAVFNLKADSPQKLSIQRGEPGTCNGMYTLSGTIIPVAASSEIAQGSQAASHHLFILQYQIWEQADALSEPKEKLPLDSVATTTTEVLDTLDLIAERVVHLLVPMHKLTVSLMPVHVEGFADRMQPFYKANLLGLLRSSLLQSGLVQLSDKAQTSPYKLTEFARVRGDRCEIVAELIKPDGTALKVPPVEGPKEQTLEIQERFTQSLIDTLRIETGSELPGKSLSGSASADEYIASAKTYEETDPELAVALYRKALTLDATNRTARQNLAADLVDLNRPKEALSVLKEPQDSLDHMLLALAYWKLKDNENTTTQLMAALETKPSNPLFYEKAATILEDLGRYDSGAKVLDVGSRVMGDKKLSKLANGLRRRGAAALMVKGKPEEALPLVLASLEQEPESEWGQRIAGIAYLELKDPRGEEYLKRAMAINPTAYAAAALGKLRMAQRRYDDAQKFAQQAIELNPVEPEGYIVLLLEIEERAQSEPNRAKEDATKAVNWLKQIWNRNPSARMAVIVLTQIQIQHLGTTAEELSELYKIYEKAVTGVPYSDWLPGWTNMVELAMLDQHFERSAQVANELLKTELLPQYRVNITFYSWLEDLLLGNCGSFKTHLSAFEDYVRRPELKGFENPWYFDGTRRFIDAQLREGLLTSQANELILSAVALLETKPFTDKSIQSFQADSSRLSGNACKQR